ncbi:hypothetical protein BACPEC_00259 [[Bacteroides] pectinophilus ATCC 43243]|uniref:Uncharacterized protein n=1 Tax=[Bacteroides] pectinophilus ATCC 43243 TaxID=483218 RepID=B7ANK5_9FIRM|nr:hypothetical protein BACPEC_00259 [[Bacteroides] pectinophilus ATCC 43243]
MVKAVKALEQKWIIPLMRVIPISISVPAYIILLICAGTF